MPQSTGTATAPAELRRQFWLLVGLFNAALLAPAVGVLLIVYEGRTGAGVVLVAVGAIALVAGIRRYRSVVADPAWTT